MRLFPRSLRLPTSSLSRLSARRWPTSLVQASNQRIPTSTTAQLLVRMYGSDIYNSSESARLIKRVSIQSTVQEFRDAIATMNCWGNTDWQFEALHDVVGATFNDSDCSKESLNHTLNLIDVFFATVERRDEDLLSQFANKLVSTVTPIPNEYACSHRIKIIDRLLAHQVRISMETINRAVQTFVEGPRLKGLTCRLIRSHKPWSDYEKGEITSQVNGMLRSAFSDIWSRDKEHGVNIVQAFLDAGYRFPNLVRNHDLSHIAHMIVYNGLTPPLTDELRTDGSNTKRIFRIINGIEDMMTRVTGLEAKSKKLLISRLNVLISEIRVHRELLLDSEPVSAKAATDGMECTP